MDKKIIVGIICIILLLAGVFCVYTYTHQQNSITVGDLSFKLPDNYKVVDLKDTNDTVITNGTNKIFFKYYNDTHIKKYINQYKDNREKENRTISISNFTVNGTLIYKSDSNAGSNHYWFVHNNKVYSIYTIKKVQNIDEIVFDLIKSSKKI